MSISIGPSAYCIGYADYAADFRPTRYDTDDSTPEQIFARYNAQDMSQQDYSQMEQELWLSKNPESHYTGLMMSVDDAKQHFAEEANGTSGTAKSSYNLMDAVEQNYKKELSGDGAKSDYYLKLYQYLSEAAGRRIG